MSFYERKWSKPMASRARPSVRRAPAPATSRPILKIPIPNALSNSPAERILAAAALEREEPRAREAGRAGHPELVARAAARAQERATRLDVAHERDRDRDPRG